MEHDINIQDMLYVQPQTLGATIIYTFSDYYRFEMLARE